MERSLAFGAVGANAVLYARVLVATAVLNPALVAPLLPYLAMPARCRRADRRDQPAQVRRRGRAGISRRTIRSSCVRRCKWPSCFKAYSWSSSFARVMWGESGVLTSAAVLGLTDVDALTVSMARGVAQTVSLEAAALAIAVGVLANTAVKLGIAVVFGSPRYRAIVGGTLLMMIVTAAAALVFL